MAKAHLGLPVVSPVQAPQPASAHLSCLWDHPSFLCSFRHQTLPSCASVPLHRLLSCLQRTLVSLSQLSKVPLTHTGSPWSPSATGRGPSSSEPLDVDTRVGGAASHP